MAIHSNIKILFIESDEVNIFVTEKTLGKHFQLTIARNGVEAIHFAHRNTFDLVLTEINLDHSMNGVEVMEELRKDSIDDSIEIWALTSSVLNDEKEYFKELGFDEYFKKPVEHSSLVEKIKQLFPQKILA